MDSRKRQVRRYESQGQSQSLELETGNGIVED
jgi:hypothetical protein